jgi:HPt (histidine-containing phosphotransfer) domain-containing protein
VTGPIPDVPSALPVDFEVARRLAGGDEDLRAEVAALFIDGCQRQQAELRAAVEAADAGRITELAHALKGSSGSVGATTVQALAAELESQSRVGRADRVVSLMGELERELGRAVEFLASRSSVGSA